MTKSFEQRVQDELDKKPLEKRETDVRLTFQELETLLALCDGVPIEASQSELWWHMNNLEVKLLEAKSRVEGDVLGDVIDSKAREDRKTQ
ncbi:hypothetical protein [Pseudomonas aeruginosa]|uniref:hypothetical protein n=1 Tax=Pseudomonas aeruginosa TaxID=287 RepID=UPI0005CD6675|nr:hypothetical protein [Pseudomonas aeruginosa]KJC15027.1 hypothetical protein TN45_31100 [Pseudomonas aeruginosa]RTU52155.1 hypothetical protein DZA25_29630 [Pseudomonas aeruginosa]